MTHILLAEEQATKKSKYKLKTLMKLRFVEINPCEKSIGSQFAKC